MLAQNDNFIHFFHFNSYFASINIVAKNTHGHHYFIAEQLCNCVPNPRSIHAFIFDVRVP